ncbi:hypothetical protein DR864_28340 (plasmid) [Runella rosea]|uniref:Protein kinase domain-containing protein n=1 Tax=Runella rosea TaxID=2259595 RepID=A0A344TT15_9BACT|nr:serine/threonine-protein kinase [Runella rosea]AXE21786.1 hypothetical protein DR864_28340 [Runella rosea]
MTAEEFYNRFEFDPSMSGSLLGRGGFSSVHKVYDKVRRRYVAVKRSEVGAFQKFDLEREVKLAHEIDIHPNIIRYENVYRIADRAGAFDYAIMKYYAEGNLDDVLRKHELNDAARRQILSGILRGLAHLHQVPIIHRDFKTANILMDRDEKGNWIPVIADFGLSRLIDADMSFVLNNSQIAHTPSYAAPEQLLDNVAIRPNTDLWAFGVMTYKMVMGSLPFRIDGAKGEWDTSNKIRSLILEGKLPTDISTIQEPYKSIIRRCLVSDPDKRVKKAEELLKLLDKGHTATTPPPSPGPSPSFDGKTKVYSAPKPTVEPPKPSHIEPKPPVKKHFPWEMLALIASVVLVGWIFYWLATRSTPQPVVKNTVEIMTDTTIVSDTSSVSIASVSMPNKNSNENQSVAALPARPTNKPVYKSPPTGYLTIETMHDMYVYIDGQLQSKRAIAGQTNNYVLPATGQGTILKVERMDLPVSRSESITIIEGKVTLRRYDIDN